MIAKRIHKSPTVPDNYTDLGRYVAAAKDKGEKLDRLWMVNFDAGDGLEDLELALTEAEAVRKLKPGVDDKTYHLVVSFRPGEEDTLSAKALKDIEQSFAEALGFADHQRIAATHRNTDHFHMHIAINKVHPRTLKVQTPFRDFKTLEQVCRRLERTYGLARDLGMSDRERGAGGLSPEARSYESQTWQQSFQRYMQEHKDEILTGLRDSRSWQAVHAHLAAFDVRLKPRGNGLAFVEAKGKQAMKASALDRSCSKGALEKRLGAYEPPQPRDQKQGPDQDQAPHHPKRRYKARPLTRHPATSRLWRRYLQQRKQPPTLLQKAMASWKLFLMTEAYADPLAMVLIMAHKEALDTFFGPAPERSKSAARKVPRSMEPLVAAWAGWAAGQSPDAARKRGVTPSL